MFWDKVESMWGHADENMYVGGSFLAFGLLRSWPVLLVISLSRIGFSGLAAMSVSLDVVIEFAQIAGFIVMTIIARKQVPLHRRGVLVLGSTVLMVVGLALFLVAAAQNAALGPLCAVGLVCSVAGYCCMYILWLELFGCISPHRVLIVFAGSTIVNALLFIFLQSAGTGLTIATLVLLPPIVCFAYLFAFKGIPREDMPSAETTPFKPYIRLAAWLGIFALALGVSNALTQTESPYNMLYLGRSICALVVLFGMVFLSDRFKLVLVYRISMPLAVIGFVIVMLWSTSAPGMSTMCLGISSWAFYSVAFIVPCAVAYQLKKSSAWICSILMTVLVGFQWGGVQLASWLEGTLRSGAGIMLLTGIVILLLILAAVVLFKESDFSAQWNLVNYPLPEKDREVDISERCEAIAREHNLSPQELKVLLLLESGMSNNEISDTLFIAPGTVRAHIGRIYKKLGVHSREELDALFEE